MSARGGSATAAALGAAVGIGLGVRAGLRRRPALPPSPPKRSGGIGVGEVAVPAGVPSGARTRPLRVAVAAGALAGRFAAWSLLGLVAGILLAAVAPLAVGARSLTVMSGSMEPAVNVGDVVVTRPVAPTALRPGDVVTFVDPDDPSKLLTHRVHRVRRDGGLVEVVTKGDANNATEDWSVPASGSVGLVLLRLPRLGYALVSLRTRPGRLLFVVAPAVALAVLELRRLGRRGARGVAA